VQLHLISRLLEAKTLAELSLSSIVTIRVSYGKKFCKNIAEFSVNLAEYMPSEVEL
jgi:hypothetical protein